MRIFGKLDRLWHERVKKHTITHFPAIKPDRVIRDKVGKPMINVFEQDTFQAPMEHWECSCGDAWM